jgi:hypothetical protein
MGDGKDETADATPSGDKSREPSLSRRDAWERLRGALKDVYAELGGGEAYLRSERNNFCLRREGK